MHPNKWDGGSTVGSREWVFISKWTKKGQALLGPALNLLESLEAVDNPQTHFETGEVNFI